MVNSLVLLLCLTGMEPDTNKSGPAPDREKLVTLAKTLVGQMSRGEFDAAVEPFDSIMKLGLPANSLKQVWDATSGQFGKFQEIEITRTETVPKYTIVFVTMAFERGKLDCKVVFDADQHVAGLFFVPSGKYEPPSYAKPDSFTEEEIRVGKGFFPLSGTLSLPKGEGPFPAVVLVHGSGPNDRDETIGPNKPFRDLAHGLASRGIAVLRYEKRTRQYSLMFLLSSGLTVKEETVNDAAAAVETLATQDKIDAKRIFVLGHSLGGMLLPRIADATDKPAGYISLAGSTRPMEDLILEQTNYILSLDGQITPDEKEALTKIEQQIALVKSKDLSADTPTADLPLGVPAKYWLDLRNYDPAAAAKKVAKPFLFLQGERDYQVTMDDLAGWKEALGKRTDVKFQTYPRLNHLFMTGGPRAKEGKSGPAEYSSPGNIDEAVIRDVADWIHAH